MGRAGQGAETKGERRVMGGRVLLNATVTPRAAALLLELHARLGVDLAAVSLHLASFVRDPAKVRNGRDLAELHAQLVAAAAGYLEQLRDGSEADPVPLVSGRVLDVAEARDLLARCGVAVGARRVRTLCESGELEGATRAGGRWSVPERSVLEYAERRRRRVR